MDVSDDDEDLKRAIALSLQEHNTASMRPQPAINLDDDPKTDIDPPLELTKVKSKQIVDLDCGDETTTDEDTLPNQTKPTVKSPPNPVHSMLGLDRKAMERERLARKRKASISPPPQHKIAKAETFAPSIPTTISKSSQTEPTVARTLENKASSIASSPPDLEFRSGAIKKTWAFGHSRNGFEIKLEEVLQRQDLTLAIFSSFQWDVEWLLRKLDTHRTQIMFVMQAKEDSTRRQYERETADMPNLRLCFPPMEGQVNCMHSKLMLLSHATYLRIVVPTANLVPYDWGETGVMENSLFLIDLPRLPDGKSTPTEDMTAFGQDLVYFLKAMGLDSKIIESIYNFDFSVTSEFAFVHTIGGAHTGEAWRRTGYCGLGRAVRQLNLQTLQELKIDFVASSIGSLNFGFMSALYLAAQGDEGLTELKWRNAIQNKSKVGKNAREKALGEEGELTEKIQKNCRIYFPSHETVATSAGGINCGGTICFQSKWFLGPEFPRELMRDCKSVRRGLLMHNKVRRCLISIVRMTVMISHATFYPHISGCTFSRTSLTRGGRNSPANPIATYLWVCVGRDPQCVLATMSQPYRLAS